MASPLAPTFGIWLVALFLQSILYGMGLIQVYLVLETFQTGMFFSAVYSILIDDFGDLQELGFIPWQALAQLFAYASTFVAQAYFSHCIYVLHKKKVILPAIIIVLSLVAFGGGIAQVILAANLKEFTELPKTSASSNTQAAVALACDVLITVGLCWRLNSHRGGIQSTNKLLSFLILTAVKRGVLTMVTALLNMILFLTQPGTFYFQLMLLLSGKFYMNSMLAMLNTRQYAHSVAKFATSGVDRISMPTLSSVSVGHPEGGINITVNRETDRERGLGRDGKVVL
ncbi:hypothetical protein C8R44DRAFT_876496 [Mycena epipterygia]|nr:hypothetical protein C8R44DRAFT_876496 [Mycena epipterygia]